MAISAKFLNFLRHAFSLLAIGVLLDQARADYTVERVVGGLNQPMYLTQAPGENDSLYIVERSDSGNSLGKIRRYNLQTHTFNTFLDLTGSIFSDGGLLGMTFHPDYQTNSLCYVTSNVSGVNALDEYKVVSGTAQMQRRLLQYDSLENVFHTINQVHFRPNGNNSELFVTTGDGGTQADSPGFDPALIESLNSPYGKLMKVDLNASYPTPATGPTHAGVDVVARGLRNPYRSSFDRLTGDFYIADVGFNTAEEVNFISSSHLANPSAPVLDFGWTDREGTVELNPGQGSPSDINPIFDYAHGGQPLPHPSLISGQSITGGYVYRGAIPELQGRYFFSDYLNGNVYSGSFNSNTNPAAFDGTNMTDIVNHTTAFESEVAGGANIQFVTSFAEDNSGNLYIIKFGNSFFPPLGQGEIFRITPISSSAVELLVDRASGAMTLVNNTGAPVNLTSLSLSSAFGGLNPDAMTPITGNYDLSGNGDVDGNNNWSITSGAGDNMLFTEATTGDFGTLAAGQSITFSPGDGWIQSPTEDLQATLLADGGGLVNINVSYTGNNGDPFERSDLDFDGELSADDWAVFIASSYTNLAGLSPAEAYGLGDLNGDGVSDYEDFQVFKADFNDANGLGAFEAMLVGVPEPSSALLMLGLAGCLSGRRSAHQR
jgi:hypothetical protein